MKHLSVVVLTLGMLSACGKQDAVPPPPQPGGAPPAGRPEKLPNGEPGAVIVKHVLIAFAGSERSTQTRSKAEAQKLAYEVLGRAKAGEDFDKLVNEFSNDSGKQAYTMANLGVQANEGIGEFNRQDMAPSFGDVSFRIAVDEIGIAEYDTEKCRFGYHIIKRIK